MTKRVQAPNIWFLMPTRFGHKQWRKRKNSSRTLWLYHCKGPFCHFTCSWKFIEVIRLNALRNHLHSKDRPNSIWTIFISIPKMSSFLSVHTKINSSLCVCVVRFDDAILLLRFASFFYYGRGNPWSSHLINFFFVRFQNAENENNTS